MSTSEDSEATVSTVAYPMERDGEDLSTARPTGTGSTPAADTPPPPRRRRCRRRKKNGPAAHRGPPGGPRGPHPPPPHGRTDVDLK